MTLRGLHLDLKASKGGPGRVLSSFDDTCTHHYGLGSSLGATPTPGTSEYDVEAAADVDYDMIYLLYPPIYIAHVM
ncbi:hypothetical protein J7T55_008261 [Diaporthe amygdali]|uniref:uncharacterized protein n=1 Tax=Phomopsis amygdali TaxID=1214568 RepID=UPI0022FE9ABD|nr:uncharacterized protein J7T55_008261 [Diaporthe amygdali]KAJ0121100.1 hypothetical protein J7T55_008261 [Diaporthe amygdali]